MSRILDLQKLNAIGVERAGMVDQAEMENSTCSFIACGNSTFSCIDCCGHSCDISEEV